MPRLDPFGTTIVRDYYKLFSEFGIDAFEPYVTRLPTPLLLMKRNIVFGSREFEGICESIEKNRKFAVMSGIKPTNYLHIGTKMVIDELKYFQEQGAITYYGIADIEALVDNRLGLEVSEKYAFDNIIDSLALGLDPDATKFFRQSRNPFVQKYAFIFSINVTNAMMRAIYGDRHIGLYMAALIQVADILLPQIEHGTMYTVVPVGVDQDPHLRLTREIARKHNFTPPSSIYHRLMSSLTGKKKKISKREPEGAIFLRDNLESAQTKIMQAFTGGRDSAVEQRRLGGQPDICPIFELEAYFSVESDNELLKIEKDCRAGELLCGEHKQLCMERVLTKLKEHQYKRQEVADIALDLLRNA
ncbi:MAG: tryptophan--tRNA ligase [Candidatus Hodarchaeota archaeon]